jgi:N-acetylneuraminate synthase
VLRIRFGAREVGDGLPVYVIAEAGSNHNGDFQQALRLIDVAAEAGADAVKFQTFKAARLYPPSAGESHYLQTPKSIYKIIEEMEMPDDWVPRLAEYCGSRSVEFMSTPFDERSADLLAPHVSVFKLASYEMSHTPLLRHVARFGKPIVLSTGAHELSEVLEAAETIRQEGNEQLVLLQCTAKYPAPPAAINAAAITTLRNATGRLVGLSDHSRDPIIAPVVATALGAAVIEKHFTLDNDLPGPDHRFAVEPRELVSMIAAIRAAELVIGDADKRVLDDEAELFAFARRSIFTTRPIGEGEELSADNMAVLRCGELGFGLAPSEFPHLIGKRAAKDLPRDRPIGPADFR